ncbi:hypothetical protein UC34_25065 (plasmid) [Pandoraea vervacti]|uniref:UspA domain-containing protein n=1 Tax=Pandoraea vervacti TaxID=656178 RepID=A0ABM5T5D4_9BURK|nr:universal stress protein [Pandoraea vervacti]AJP60173.1 hypothetical protein UC34_25065 [Pandoraea vervacti]
MSYRTLLVHVDNSDQCRARVAFAAAMAARLPAHLTGLYLPFRPENCTAAAPTSRRFAGDPLRPESDVRRLAYAERTFSDVCDRQALVAEWLAPQSDDSCREMRTRARYTDLVIVGQEDRNDPETSPSLAFVDSVVLNSGRPVLILPYAGAPPTTFENILLAWDGGREAARAMVDALPLLRAAKVVRITNVRRADGSISLGPIPGADIAIFAARHGVPVEVTPELGGNDVDIGERLLSRAADHNAQLIVMGAYGHSRMQEWVLGGVTRTMLERMRIPVMMSH